MATPFAVTWDYRCPFARNAHEHVITALEAGAPWDVKFRAFSLDQAHVGEGGVSVWEEPGRYPGLLANEAGIVIRDRFPDRFLRAHRALFAARHDQGKDLRQRPVLAGVLSEAGLDAGAVLAEIDDGWPLEVLRDEHTGGVDELELFGVPTWISGSRAVFVRLLDRPGEDAAKAVRTVQRVIDILVGWPELNELKHTQLRR